MQENNESRKYTLKDLTEIAFQIIVKAGTAKSFAMESLYAAKENDYNLSGEKMKQAHESMSEAEKEHFVLIRDEAQGIPINVPLILMHAEDQLLSTQSIIILTEELIEIYKKMDKSK